MGTLANSMAYGLRQLLSIQGGAITFRHRTTLSGGNPSPNPPIYIAPIVNGATLAGASTIDFSVDYTQGGVFTGRLIAGDTFEVAGDPTIYTVTADTVSPSTSDTLTTVPFTPVLALNAADGAAVTFGFAADTPNIPALITDYPSRLIDGSSIQEKDHQIRFLASDLVGVEPLAGDQIILPGGDIAEVIAVSHMEVQGSHYGWSVHVRA